MPLKPDVNESHAVAVFLQCKILSSIVKPEAGKRSSLSAQSGSTRPDTAILRPPNEQAAAVAEVIGGLIIFNSLTC